MAKNMKWAISISKTLQFKNPNKTTHIFINPSFNSLKSQFLPRFFATISSSTLDQNPSFHSQGEYVRGIWSKMLLFVPGAISFGLGTWQIFRRQDKEIASLCCQLMNKATSIRQPFVGAFESLVKMLEYRKERLEMEPIKFKATSGDENTNTIEFRKVLCKGAFDEKKSIYVGPRSRSISGGTENGYYLVTPLSLISGDPESVQHPILVNRGWVPRRWRDKALESSEDVEDTTNLPSPSKHTSWRFWSKKQEKTEEQALTVRSVEVVGVIRESEKPSNFVPANDPASGQWFYVGIPTIARAAGLPENTIYIEDINENVCSSSPYPVPKDANTLIRSSVMPQDHLNYMLTWYSLSAAVTFMAYKRLKPRRSRR